jgi:DNA-binding response OmpR family regulator
MRNGADFYAPFCEETEMNIEGVIAAIEGVRRRAVKGKSPCKILAHGNILIDAERHKAFVKDKEVVLSGAEMAIFHYLLLNRGITLTHEQFFQNVYDGNDRITTDGLYSAIKRLRKKIREVTQTEYIETVKNVGYCLWTEGR